MEDMNHESCRICGQTTSFTDLHFRTNGEYRLHKCDRCGTVIVDSRPTSEELSEVYDTLFAEGGYKVYRDRHRDLLAGKLPKSPFLKGKMLHKIGQLAPGRTMVEIGGGTGAFGAIVSSQGWSYADYDISQVAVGFVRDLGLEAHCFEETDLPPIQENSVDAIVMWEVIEHIWPVHQYLVKLRDALHRNGVLAISTPNLRRKGYMNSLAHPGPNSPPIHLNFFTQEALSATLEAAGYSRIQFIHRRVYRSDLKLRSLIYNAKIALGIYETKTLYVLAIP
ncbi:MAG: class I SAM-dependent methyltransferase [Anaerolineae bacterium]|nr:class I SAM-dependent methyltransferase [Anaerolineae bacterium]